MILLRCANQNNEAMVIPRITESAVTAAELRLLIQSVSDLLAGAESLEWPPDEQVQGRVTTLGKATGEVDRPDKGIGADE